MRHMHAAPIALVIASFAVSSCAAAKEPAQTREALHLAATRIEASDLRGPAHSLEAMIAESPRDRSADQADDVQRFYAATLLVRAHVAAAFTQPFLASPEAPRGS